MVQVPQARLFSWRDVDTCSDLDRLADPDAGWGHRSTSAVDANGKAWSKVKNWFGQGSQVIVDTHDELPVAVVVTSASDSPTVMALSGTPNDESHDRSPHPRPLSRERARGDSSVARATFTVTLRQMIGELFAEEPVLVGRCEDSSAQHGLDAGETKALLRDTCRSSTGAQQTQRIPQLVPRPVCRQRARKGC